MLPAITYSHRWKYIFSIFIQPCHHLWTKPEAEPIIYSFGESTLTLKAKFIFLYEYMCPDGTTTYYITYISKIHTYMWVYMYSAGFRHRQTRQLPRAPRNWGANKFQGAPKFSKKRQIIA